MCEICQSIPHLTGCPNAKPETIRCVWCKDDVPASDVKKIGRDYVCGDCEAEYLFAHRKPFVKPFVQEHEQEYYLDWWWSFFSDEEKTTLLKKLYEQYYHYHDWNGEERFTDQSDFCMEDSRFPDFIREGLDEKP